MKREIKCRGFHKFAGVSGWVYGSLLKDGKTYYITQSHSSYSVEPGSIGEFTGLRDAYLKEIYENDIIQRGRFVKGFVVFYKGGWYVKNAGNEYRLLYEWRLFDKLHSDSNRAKVIGNTYENKNLLK